MALTDEQIKVIYEEDIKPQFFNKVSSVQNPTSIFLAGQPGSGKTNIVEHSIKELNNNAVVIDPDHIRQYHPEINNVKDQYTLDVDSRKWKAMLIQDCIKDKKNIVFDGTFGGNIDYIEQDIRKVKDNGHRIKLNVLSTNDSVSKLGFNYRYEDQLSKFGKGRPVDLSYHDEIYKKIPNNITVAVGKGLVDEMSIYKRNHETKKSELIQNFDRNTLKHSKDSPIYEFDKERARPFTNGELSELKIWYAATVEKAYHNGSDINKLKSLITTDDIRSSDLLKQQIEHIKDTKNLVPNLELKDSVLKNDPHKAYESVKKGADISTLKSTDFKDLNILQEKSLKLAMQKGLDDFNKDKGKDRGIDPKL